MKNLVILIVIVFCAGAAAAEDLAVDQRANQWKVYNINAATYVYHIQKPASLAAGGMEFPLLDKADGWFTNYLLANPGTKDISGKTITATVNLAATAGTLFYTRSTTCPNSGVDAYVRLEFQDVTAGNYGPNDYWWSTGDNSLNLSSLAIGGPQMLSISTADRAKWTNIAGRPATDTTAPWTNYDGTIQTVSPYDGFTDALKKVKQIGLAFGSSCRYASGVATDGGSGTFQLLNYRVE